MKKLISDLYIARKIMTSIQISLLREREFYDLNQYPLINISHRLLFKCIFRSPTTIIRIKNEWIKNDLSLDKNILHFLFVIFGYFSQYKLNFETLFL